MARVYTEIVDLYIENKEVYYTKGWINAASYGRSSRNGDKLSAVSLRYYDIVLGNRAGEGVEDFSIDRLKSSKIYNYSFTVSDGNEIVGRLLFMCREKEFNEVMKAYTQPYKLKSSIYRFNQVYKDSIFDIIRREYGL